MNGVSYSAVFYYLSIQKYKSHVVKTMNNQDMKIYFDSSHYIGIPKEAFARKKGSKSHVVKSVQKIQKNKRLKHQLKPHKNVLKRHTKKVDLYPSENVKQMLKRHLKKISPTKTCIVLTE